MLMSYEASRTDSFIGGIKDKKRQLTHLELLDKYYDEGIFYMLFCTFDPITGRIRTLLHCSIRRSVILSKQHIGPVSQRQKRPCSC